MLPALRVGEWLVQPDRHLLTAPHEEIRLAPRVLRVPTLLAERPGETPSCEEIPESVWGVLVSDELLTNAIKELGKAFRDEAHDPRYIRTSPKNGNRRWK